MDCHEAIASRNDDKIESCPHTNLESKADSESTSGGVYLHRDKNKIARSANLEASSGVSGISANGLQGGMERACNSSPSPLDEKKTESNEVLESQKVKAKDSEKLDSESKMRAESARAGGSKKQDLESKGSESAIDSEFKNKQVEIFRLLQSLNMTMIQNLKS